MNPAKFKDEFASIVSKSTILTNEGKVAISSVQDMIGKLTPM
jgi:hypothetical protein